MTLEDMVVDIQILNMEDHGSNVVVHYSKIYGNGRREVCRTHVRNLGGYYQFFSAKPIVAAECVGKVYLGIIKSDARMLFVAKMNDGSAELIQVKEGSAANLKLFQVSENMHSGSIQPPPPLRPQASNESVKPYQLGKNELPQGKYLIGQDIPAGTYDFFVVYGTRGRFEVGKYDANDKAIDGTWDFYWVGLKEDYEKRELIHIACEEGYTVKISGNVILKIARSQQVRIDL